MGRAGSPLARLGALIALVALVAGVRALPAAAVPPELVLPPERLYTLVDTPIAFTGTDPISGDDRTLDVTVTEDGCAPSAGNGWSLGGCARVQMAVAHGELSVPLETVLGGAGQPDGIVAGGAIADQSTDGDGTGAVLHLNGTEAQLDDALALLTYTPASGYEYDGSNPEGLQLTVVDGTTPADDVGHEVQIVVGQVNDGPDLTVPDQAAVPAGGTVSLPAVEPLPGMHGDLWVEDPDITEGEGDEDALVAMIATCGEFTLRGGAMTLGEDLEDLLIAQGVPQPAVDALLALLPAEVVGQMYASGSPLDPHQALVAVAELDEIDYALSQVDFDAPAADGTCELLTVVTHLGGNGLPLQYLGSPLGGRDQPQPGVEVPAFGVDLGVTTFVVGQGVELDLPPALSVAEGATLAIPVSVSTGTHPEIDLAVTATGVTAAGADYDEPASPVVVPQDDSGPVPIDLVTVEDADDEADETLTVSIALVGAPPGVTVDDGTVTVTITDDDDGPDTTAPTVTVEQAAGQADPTSTPPIRFDVTFSEPVTGLEPADIDLTGTTAGGPPTVADVDGAGASYTILVVGMTTAGDVVAGLPADAVADAAGNGNEPSTSVDDVVAWDPSAPDVTPPTATLDQAPGQADPTSTSPTSFRITFDEPVTGVEAADVDTAASTVGGALAVAVTEIDPATYDVAVTGMTTAGDVVVALPAGGVEDLAGNVHVDTDLVDDTVTWEPAAPDVTVPTVVVDQADDQADPTSVAPIRFTATFSEPVTGVEPDDVLLDASTAGGDLVATVEPTGQADGTVFTIAVTGMTTAGDVSLAIVGGAAADAAGNASLASTAEDGVVTWAGPLVVDPIDPVGPVDPVDGGVWGPGAADGDTYNPGGYAGSLNGGGAGVLARTGLDIAGLLVLGTGVVGLGLGLVLAARRPWGRTG